MKNLVDLLALYVEVNQQLLEENKNESDTFKRLT